MGDRAHVIFVSKDEVSPTVYLHWMGSHVSELLKELKELMQERTDDPSYACARLIGIAHSHHVSNLSLGVSETPSLTTKALSEEYPNLKDSQSIRVCIQNDYSLEDNGMFVVDAADFTYSVYR